MRVTCPFCESKASITNSDKVNKGMKRVYANCGNYNCNARFVLSIAHIGTKRMPDFENMNSLEEQIAQMDPDRRKQILQKYEKPVPQYQPTLL